MQCAETQITKTAPKIFTFKWRGNSSVGWPFRNSPNSNPVEEIHFYLYEPGILSIQTPTFSLLMTQSNKIFRSPIEINAVYLGEMCLDCLSYLTDK